MINLNDFKTFESLSNSDLDLSAILASGVFAELEKIGAKNVTTDRIWKNGNFKLFHPVLAKSWKTWSGEQVDVDDYVTIYSNGPIRGTSSGRPFIMGSAPGSPITNMKEFMEKLKWVLSYLKKKIGKDVFDITTKVPLEELVKTDTKGFFSMLFRREPAKFLEWLDKQEQLVAKEALKSIDLKDFIEEDPVKAASILRKYYNVPEIREVFKKLDPSVRNDFEQDLNLLGGLNTLGF